VLLSRNPMFGWKDIKGEKGGEYDRNILKIVYFMNFLLYSLVLSLHPKHTLAISLLFTCISQKATRGPWRLNKA
jgi:hypothetical protein